MGTKERRPLRLDNPPNRGLGTAWTGVSSTVVDAVFILVAAGLVQGIAIGPVRQCRTLITNGRMQNLTDGRMNRLPLLPRQPVTSLCRMDPCQVQNLRSVQVADTRHNPLVKQGDFDSPTTLLEPLT